MSATKYLVGHAASSKVKELMGRLAHSTPSKEGYPLRCSVLPPPVGGRNWGGTLATRTGPQPVIIVLLDQEYQPAGKPGEKNTICVTSDRHAFSFCTTTEDGARHTTTIRGTSNRDTMRKAEEYLFNQALID